MSLMSTYGTKDGISEGENHFWKEDCQKLIQCLLKHILLTYTNIVRLISGSIACKEMIYYNTYDYESDDGSNKSLRKIQCKIKDHSHELLSFLKKNFDGAKVTESTSNYPQLKSKMCNKIVQIYCSCFPDLICCFVRNICHLIECKAIIFSLFSFDKNARQ